MSETPKGKLSVSQVLAEATALRNRTRPEATEQSKSLLQTNTFAHIMLNHELSPEAKRDALAREMTFDKDATKEQNRAKQQAFAEFKEYLQEQRKILNREGIKLQDTEAFAELQTVIDDMTKASVDFQQRVQPLIEILTAVFEIRKNDKIFDVYAEIQKDKEWTVAQNETLEKLEKQVRDLVTKEEQLVRERAERTAERSFFGLGPPTKRASARIAEIDQVDLVRVREDVTSALAAIEQQKALIQQGRSSENPELLKQKQVLREFLDLTKEENRSRQKSLVAAAVHYVDTSDVRLKSVLTTLGKLGNHAEVVSDTNGILRNMHLIMDEAMKEAAQHSHSVKSELEHGAAGESSIARMSREEKLSDANEFIGRMDDHAIDIANSIGGLTKHAVQIQAYKDTIRNESGSTKRLHLEGVSQMGEQLMSVLSAVSAAATSESRSVAANNFARMAAQNQGIISHEVIRNATTIDLEAQQISRLVGELQDYGDVLKATSDIASAGYNRMRDTIGAIRKVSGAVQEAIGDLVDERADAHMGGGSREDADVKKIRSDSDLTNPFDKLGNQ
jgi:hypothetical protein